MLRTFRRFGKNYPRFWINKHVQWKKRLTHFFSHQMQMYAKLPAAGGNWHFLLRK